MGERFNRWLARRVTSPLQGVRFGPWWRRLREPDLRVHPEFLPRAVTTTLSALVNSVQARIEQRRFGAAVAAARPSPPLFVLGHYRSGTTHLHNLLALDPRFTAPNYYRVSFPHTFLTTERFGARIGAWLSPSRRPHDDVAIGVDSTAEDELALCATTFLSPHMGWHFPEAEARFRKYLTFRDAEPGERRAWIEALRHLARKLTVAAGRPIVFKSPCHDARIPLLLAAFPDARFVHIRRDPLRVYRSTCHMERAVTPYFQFQRRDPSRIEDFVLWRYREINAAYLEHRAAIPAGRLVEVTYESLVRDPLPTLARVYSELGLADFSVVRPRVAGYLASLGGYRLNSFPSLEDPDRRRVVREWERFFTEWGYEPSA